MIEKILFVDDEPAVLEGYRRMLRADFPLRTALSGDDGIAEIGENGPFGVVISDMRMPGMDGVQFLSRVREIAPQTVRVVLTGYGDLETAMNAVNEDAVFRFLTKPCSEDVLKKTLTACLVQYRLVTAERELLESTLMGSIKVLTDVLSLASPAAFARSLRVNRYVQHIVRQLKLQASWKYEAAAMLSQLGCITLEPELLEAAYHGAKLDPDDQAHFHLHPAVACSLLRNIPRLEGIAWIVGQQFGSVSGDTNVSEGLETGAAILRVALAFDDLKVQGRSDLQAIAELQASYKFDARIVQALVTLQPTAPEMESRVVEVANLEPGMIVDEEIRSNLGPLLAAKGHEVTYPLVVRLKNFRRRRAVKERVAVLVPRNGRH
jgi:FixJ family two-component response regulator